MPIPSLQTDSSTSPASNRLDRLTSGVMVCALTAEASKKLGAWFGGRRNHEGGVSKEYVARCLGKLPECVDSCALLSEGRVAESLCVLQWRDLVRGAAIDDRPSNRRQCCSPGRSRAFCIFLLRVPHPADSPPPLLSAGFEDDFPKNELRRAKQHERRAL